MSLIGQADVSIDAKNRLPIPAKFRDDSPSAEGESEAPPAQRTVWVSTPRADRTIWLFPIAAFNTLASMLEQSLSPEDDFVELNRTLAGYSEKIAEDSAHRIIVPKKHLDLVEMPRDVTLVGAFNHLEIHDRAEWQAREADRLAKLPTLSAKLAAMNRARTHGQS